MKKQLIKLFCLSLIIFSSLGLSVQVSAQEQGSNNQSLAETIGGPAEAMQGSAGLSDVTIGVIVAAVVRAALGLLGIIFLIIIIFAGYRWMTASGNEEAIKKAQDAIKRAIIGLVIVILAYAITAFIFNQLPFDGFGGGNSSTIGG